MATKKRNRLKKYDKIEPYVPTQKEYKLVFCHSFLTILNRVSDMGNDRVVMFLLELYKKPSVKTRINYICSTNKNYLLSYCLPEKAKNEKEAFKKENREAIELKKFLNKITKGSRQGGYLSNTELDKFISKYKKVHSDIQKEKELLERDKKINFLENINKLTETGELKWGRMDDDLFYKYTTSYLVTDKKYLNIELYVTNDDKIYITIYYVFPKKDGSYDVKFIDRIDNDPIGLSILEDSITKNMTH